MRLRLLAGSLLLVPAFSAHAETFTDDFDGGTIDPAKWSVPSTACISQVTVQGGAVELIEAGHLTTVAEFDPRLAPLTITGLWAIGSEGDRVIVTTRMDGTVGSAPCQILNGLQFVLHADWDGIRIYQTVDGAISGLADTPMPVAAAELFEFRIVDDGSTVTFTVAEIDGDGTTATLTASSSLDTGVNHVNFNNYSTGAILYSYLDDVVITGQRPVSVESDSWGGVKAIYR